MAKSKETRPSPQRRTMDSIHLALTVALFALVLPLYHPVERIQQLTPALSATLSSINNIISARPVPPKLEKISPKVRILSYDPLVAHLHDFLTWEERQYLLKLGRPLLKRSQVQLNNGTWISSPGRTSSTAAMPKNDTVVQHILERASEFQGYLPTTQMDMQLTAYQPGQQYRIHYDWFPRPNPRSMNRFSSFFAILEADCENCGTAFPKIELADELDPRWCDAVDCTKSHFTSINRPGGAIFWRNLDDWGVPRTDVLHAGLPAINGTKFGLNIWTEIPVDPELYPPADEILPAGSPTGRKAFEAEMKSMQKNDANRESDGQGDGDDDDDEDDEYEDCDDDDEDCEYYDYVVVHDENGADKRVDATPTRPLASKTQQDSSSDEHRAKEQPAAKEQVLEHKNSKQQPFGGQTVAS